MRVVVVVGIALTIGCFDPVVPMGLQCTDTGQCPPGQACLANTCEQLSCSEICGDVDQNGQVNQADRAHLNSILAGNVPSDPCNRSFGDVDGDGELSQADGQAIVLLVTGRAVGGCEICGDVCGDVDGDGAIDSTDAEAIGAFASESEQPTVCQFVAADVDGSRTIDAMDSRLVVPLGTGAAIEGCRRCDQECGDVDPNNDVELRDVAAARDIVLSGEPPPLCVFAAADVNWDDEVTNRDVDIIDAIAKGDAVGMCEACTGVCGDVDQNGQVDDGDILAIESIDDDSIVPTPCQFDSADVDGDGDVDQDDVTTLGDGAPLICE